MQEALGLLENPNEAAARIARLYVSNYRCLVDFELHPGPRTLLLGDNGAGKSSVFEVLAGVQDVVCRGEAVDLAFPTSRLTKLCVRPLQRFELDVESEWGTFRYSLAVAHKRDREEPKIESEEVLLNGKPLYRFADTEVQLFDDDHVPAKGAFSFSPKSSFLASIGPDALSARLAWLKRAIGAIWILRPDPTRMDALSRGEGLWLERNGSNFASWLRRHLLESPESMGRAQETLREIIHGYQSLRMVTAGRAMVLVVKFRDSTLGAYELDFDALSDGQKLLIVYYTVLELVGGQATLLCLDEPDNFVSIREIQPFLVKLADLADHAGVQSLVVSHSSEVIDFMGASNAILMEREEGGGTRKVPLISGGPLRLSELVARGWHVAS